jgi:hypothetical protein
MFDDVLYYHGWEEISGLFQRILNAGSVVHTNVDEPPPIASCRASDEGETFKFVVLFSNEYWSRHSTFIRSDTTNIDALKDVRLQCNRDSAVDVNLGDQ